MIRPIITESLQVNPKRLRLQSLQRMAYKLKSGETPEDAARLLLGDSRLTNEIHIINGTAYIRGEKLGPPAKYAADPTPKKEPSE